MSSRRQQGPPRKGAEIRFVGGRYEGRIGWINDAKSPTKMRTYVIVYLGSGQEYPTLVAHKNFSIKRQEQPATYAAAVFQQQPKIEKKLKELCAQLAKCGIGEEEDLGGVTSIIKRELKEAVEVQRALGSDAEYKVIRYRK